MSDGASSRVLGVDPGLEDAVVSRLYSPPVAVVPDVERLALVLPLSQS